MKSMIIYESEIEPMRYEQYDNFMVQIEASIKDEFPNHIFIENNGKGLRKQKICIPKEAALLLTQFFKDNNIAH